MLCPRHPKVQMTESGRRYEGYLGITPVMHCAVCIKAQREKLAVLMALPYRCGTRRQVVLPPVRMPWY